MIRRPQISAANFGAIVVLVVSGALTGATANSGKSFEEIMESVSAAGLLSNGDGHRWKFRRNSSGSWEVEGARSEVARVTDAGVDLIKIDGFPANWGANGKFEFSKEGDKCRLKSDHSNHRLKWKC